MSTLSVSNNMRAGADEISADLAENFTDVSTWANGLVSDTNFTSGYRAIPALTLRRELLTVNAPGVTSTTAQTYQLTRGDYQTATLAHASSILAWSTTIYGITGYTGSFRLAVSLLTNTTAPAASYVFSLYPVSTSTGANPTLTVGAAVTSSGVTFTTPSASTLTSSSATFTAPATGNYLVGFTASGTQAVGSYFAVSAELTAVYA